MLSVEKSPLEIDKWQRIQNYVPEFPLLQLAGFSSSIVFAVLELICERFLNPAGLKNQGWL